MSDQKQPLTPSAAREEGGRNRFPLSPPRRPTHTPRGSLAALPGVFAATGDSPFASSCSQPYSEANHRSCQWGTKNANYIHRALPSHFIIYACPKVLLFRLYSKAILLMICLMFSLYTVVLIHSCQRNMSFLIRFKGNKPQRLVKYP